MLGPQAFTTRGAQEMMSFVTSARTRIGKRDIAIAGVLTLLGQLLMWGNVKELTDDVPPKPDQVPNLDWGGLLPAESAYPLFLLVTVPLLWRRVAPLPAMAVAFGGLLLNEVLVGTDLLRCGVVLPTACFFAFTAGAQLSGRGSQIGLALAGGLTLVDFSIGFDPVTTAVMTTVTVSMWVIGRIVRSRSRMADELSARTEELRHARDERARMKVATERTRISRELDTLLQRRLGELARLADQGTQPGNGAVATTTLAAIEREGRRTLEEMRAVVGVLRDDAADAPTAPQPALVHLEALLVRAKGAGARLEVDGNPRVLPAAVELTAYRIVEQLLSALEDAPDVEVQVRFVDGALELAVSGPARRGAKAAIERARERVRLERGTLDATVRGGRAEAVATLPTLKLA
jgi:signal transduction histidine kinase